MSRPTVVHRPCHSSSQPDGSGPFLHWKIVGAAALAAIVVAGCSADITRFDGQGYGLTDNSSAKIPSQGLRRGETARLGDVAQDGGGAAPSGGAYYPPPANYSPNGDVRPSLQSRNRSRRRCGLDRCPSRRGPQLQPSRSQRRSHRARPSTWSKATRSMASRRSIQCRSTN